MTRVIAYMMYNDTLYVTVFEEEIDASAGYAEVYEPGVNNETDLDFLRDSWEYGNYSCDCNRGQYINADRDWKCGQAINLLALHVLKDDGESLVVIDNISNLGEVTWQEN